MAHRLSCSASCGIFLDQGSNPCPLHWQADSQSLCHQGSPRDSFTLQEYGRQNNGPTKMPLPERPEPVNKLHGKRDFEDVIKDLEMGDCPR